MKVRGLEELHKFIKKHNQAKGSLEAWHDEVCRANWKTPQDIKDKYNHVDFRPKNRVIFNIKGNDYRLVVQVIYIAGVVVIEKIGTHAEYDRWRL